jgi:hydrogenase/urease accessory protein HupE
MLLGASPAAAHPLAPAVLELRSLHGGLVEVRWRLARPRPRGTAPRPLLPPACEPQGGASEEVSPDAITTRWRVDCGADGLIGQTLEIAGLESPLAAVVRVHLTDGRTADGVLTAAAPRFVVPAAPSRLAVLGSYLRLGLVHIATGPDHLLFVFGLVLLAATWRQVLTTVTAFTVGHSVTLALATLGVVVLPSGPVELAIALSVLVVAIEVARGASAGPSARPGRPWLLAGCFGLLHGLGFASVLQEAGLPSSAIPLALFAFNLGIELGQVTFVLALLVLGAGLRRLAPPLPRWTRRVPAYLMGTAAAYWCFQRAAVWLAA